MLATLAIAGSTALVPMHGAFAQSAGGLSAEERARGEELYLHGQRLYEEGDYANAIDAWQLGYDTTEAPLFLYNIAAAHERDGDYGAAAETLRAYRDVAPPEERATLSRRIANLEARVQDAQDAQERREAEARAANVERVAQTSAAEATQDADSVRAFGPGQWAATGVALSALAGGVVLGVQSRSLLDDVEDLCVNGTCLETAQDDYTRGRRMAIGADVLFGVAGVSALSAIISAAVRAGKDQQTGRELSGGVVPTRDGAVFTFGGRF